MFRTFETRIRRYCKALDLYYESNNLKSFIPFHEIIDDEKNIEIVRSDFGKEDYLGMYGNHHALCLYLFIFFELNKFEISKITSVNSGNPYYPLLIIILNNGHLWKHHGQIHVDQFNIAYDSRFINFEMPDLTITFLEYLSSKLEGKILKNILAEDIREIYFQFMNLGD